MPATIKIKNSSTASAVPTSSDLVQGELAVNVTDRRLFTENAGGTVVELGTNPTILTMGAAGSASAPVITRTGDTNTGIFFPAADTIAFSTNGTEDARFDSAGNFGLGVTPSAWSGYGVPVIEAPAGGTFVSAGNGNIVGSNWYYAASNFTYKTTNAASYYYQVNGQHRWYNAASGTAGNAITFTQAMTLDASGNLGVGKTSPGVRLDVSSSIANIATFNSSTDGYILITQSGAAQTLLGAVSTTGFVGTATNHDFVFRTNNAERARITSSGNLLLGTTTIGGVGLTFQPSAGNIIQTYSGTGANTMTEFKNNNGTVGYISSSGTTTSYVTSSDYRLKENISPMTGALAKVAALKPCTYKWKADGSDGEGFIAHELQAVVPAAVSGEKDAVNEDGSIKPQGIDTSFLVATLTAAIQELKAELDAAKARITALEA